MQISHSKITGEQLDPTKYKDFIEENFDNEIIKLYSESKTEFKEEKQDDEYKNQDNSEQPKENKKLKKGNKIGLEVGLGLFFGGSILSVIFPPVGIPLAISGFTTYAASGISASASNKSKKLKRTVTKKKKYLVNYEIYSNGDKKETSKVLVGEEIIYGEWENC